VGALADMARRHGVQVADDVIPVAGGEDGGASHVVECEDLEGHFGEELGEGGAAPGVYFGCWGCGVVLSVVRQQVDLGRNGRL